MKRKMLEGLLSALVPTLRHFIERHVEKQLTTRDTQIAELRREVDELSRKSAG